MDSSHQLSAQARTATVPTQLAIRDLVLHWFASQPRPATAGEAAAALAPQVAAASRHNLTTRVFELEKGGALEKVGQRACSVSGQVASVYRATGRPYRPSAKVKKPKAATRAEGLQEAISLAEELRSLRPEWDEPIAVLVAGLQAAL